MNIRLNNINCFYGTHQILFNMTLYCHQGDILVLLGPNGAGKSSLLRVLNLLEIPHSGTLDIVNKHFDFKKTLSNKVFCNFKKTLSKKVLCNLRKNVGMVFQQYNLWPHLTVLQNLIEAPCRLLDLSKIQLLIRANRLLERLRLKPYINYYPLYLSSGQQQCVAIARALMMQPQVLLFDEPTSALDPETTSQIINIILELSKIGVTQIVVTHKIEIARKIANHVVYMENGHIIEQGDVNCFYNPQTNNFKKFLSFY